MKFVKILLIALFPVTGFAQQVTWDVSLWGKRRAFTEHVEKLSELVAEKTNGEFILNLSYGGLAKPKENLDGISAGLFEMAQFCAGYHREKNPSITVLELPFLGVKTLAEERTISQWLYRHPSVLQDFKKWNAIALMPSPLPQYNLIGVGNAPESLMQLSGLDVRATGGIGRAMEALGAFPKPLVATEVRQALESRDVNAVAFAPHAHVSFGTVASADWWTTNLNPGTVNCPVVANLDAVARLSTAHRDALYGSINEALDYYISRYEYNMKEVWEPLLQQLDIQKVTFNETEINYFKERVEKPAAIEWVAEHEKDGLPAKEIYSLVKIALSGENPEQALFSGRVKPQTNLLKSNDEAAKTEKQKILDAFTFDKEQSPTTTTSTLASIEAKTSDKPIAPLQETAAAVQESGTPVIKGGIAALFFNDRTAIEESVNAYNPTATNPATTDSPAINTVNDQAGNYFGVPRNGAPVAYDTDPLQMDVEWDLEDNTTVGSAIATLSDFIGYELLTDNETAIQVYGRKLPRMQQKINRITVDKAFQILSGRGLVTVFDHTYRTVKHLPR